MCLGAVVIYVIVSSSLGIYKSALRDPLNERAATLVPHMEEPCLDWFQVVVLVFCVGLDLEYCGICNTGRLKKAQRQISPGLFRL